MAFNPFHGFRKHSKVIFAILTIICMITFILSFGRGDFFEWIVGMVGASKKGEVVTTLYGDKVYDLDVNKREHARRDANVFLRVAIARGQQIAVTKARDELSRLAGSTDLSEAPELAAYRDQLRHFGGQEHQETVVARRRLECAEFRERLHLAQPHRQGHLAARVARRDDFLDLRLQLSADLALQRVLDRRDAGGHQDGDLGGRQQVGDGLEPIGRRLEDRGGVVGLVDVLDHFAQVFDGVGTLGAGPG